MTVNGLAVRHGRVDGATAEVGADRTGAESGGQQLPGPGVVAGAMAQGA